LCKLAASGFNVVGVHFLSHGKSPRLKEAFTFDDLLQNVRDAIGYCDEHYSGNLFLLGSSQGGILATAAADDRRLGGVLVHDTILPELEETAELLNLPGWLRPGVKSLLWCLKVLAWLIPRYQVPVNRYLDAERLTLSEALVERYKNDPLSRKSYPLSFIVSLFHADMHVATDGSISCPFVMIAALHDPLFDIDYIRSVFDRIVAPSKELMSFDLPYHLLFIEAEEDVLGPIVSKLHSLSSRS
jgi:alpha-beta hydrolase superfamily lysophospholipase